VFTDERQRVDLEGRTRAQTGPPTRARETITRNWAGQAGGRRHAGDDLV
jgi:hypothetical protein